jgi:hypothetical protein
VVLNTTIAANSATALGPGGAGSIFGGNVYSGNTSMRFKNSIVAAGVGGPGNENCFGSTFIVSDGHNIDSLNQCGFTSTGDQVNTNPLLGPLQDNGGPVQTMALLAGSSAIDTGDNAGCPGSDARGVLRPAGAACDIGAFEIATPSAITGTATGVTTTAATLNGTARNPNLGSSSVVFQYGTTTAYGSSTTPQPVRAITAGAPFSAAIAGLSQKTSYHFREVVTNAISTSLGADQTFTTAAPPAAPQPPRAQSPQLTVSGSPRVSARGRGLTVTLVCGPTAKCPVSIVATTTEKLKGNKIVGVAKTRRRTVVVAASSLTIAAGKRQTITVRLNATGRRLLARFKKLPVKLTISLIRPDGKKTTVKVTHLTLRQPSKHRHHTTKR